MQLTTHDCPHTFPIVGSVAVDRGPVTLTYGWSRDGGPPTGVRTAAFPGTSAQQKSVVDDDRVGPALDGRFRDELVVIGQTYDRSHAAARIELKCLASVTATATVTDHARPYLTDVSATVTVAGGPVEVRYQWILSNGDVDTSAVDFTGTGVQSRDIVEHVDLDNVASLSYRVKLTDVIPYTSPAVTISCDPPKP